MADHQASSHVVDAARRALAEQSHYQLGKLLAHWTDIEGATTVDLSRLAEQNDCSLSTLYNAIAIYRLAKQVGLSEEDVARIGYTKLTLVATHADDDLTRDGVFALCEGRTVAGLKASLAGAAGSVKPVTFALNQSQRRALDAALVRHGAVRVGRGLRGKEAALMKILSRS